MLLFSNFFLNGKCRTEFSKLDSQEISNVPHGQVLKPRPLADFWRGLGVVEGFGGQETTAYFTFKTKWPQNGGSILFGKRMFIILLPKWRFGDSIQHPMLIHPCISRSAPKMKGWQGWAEWLGIKKPHDFWEKHAPCDTHLMLFQHFKF